MKYMNGNMIWWFLHP